MDRALDLSEYANISDIYKVDFLYAIQAWNRIWGGIIPAVISNCWRKTGTLVENDSSISGLLQTEQAQIEGTLQGLVLARVKITFLDLLSPEGEDDCTSNASDADLVH